MLNPMANVAYINQAPRIEIVGEIARVFDRSGATHTERAMPVAVLARYVERGQRALRQHAAGDSIVIIDD